jgi:F-type H+-transporting ATPase subunit gamma
LCGGYNANVLRKAFSLANELGDNIKFVAIGTKGRDYFRRRRREIVHTLKGISETPFYDDAQIVANLALEKYNSGEVNQVCLVYTEYESMLTQTPCVKYLLPLEVGNGDGLDLFVRYDEPLVKYFEHTVAAYLASAIMQAMLESSLCMQCARITGMDSASKNSEDIIENLTLQYNQMRQGAITQEIAEIVGGANAISQKAK